MVALKASAVVNRFSPVLEMLRKQFVAGLFIDDTGDATSCCFSAILRFEGVSGL